MEKFKNIEMEAMFESAAKHLQRDDIIGYAAARNVRVLGNELKEYAERKQKLLNEYGEPVVGEDGKPTGEFRVDAEGERFGEFVSQLETFALIEHEPKVFRIPFSEAIGKLTGTELLEIDWMFEE